MTSPNKADMSVQRRDFILTLWPVSENLTSEAILNTAKEDISRLNNCVYSMGQLELSCENKKRHMQVYVKLNKSTRGRTVMKHFSNSIWKGNPHTEFCLSPEASRSYCMKDTCEKCGEGAPKCARVHGTEPITSGLWIAPSRGKSKRNSEVKSCSDLIKEGRSASFIAWHYPHLFLKYGNKITSTIHYRELYQQRQKFLAEEDDDEEE